MVAEWSRLFVLSAILVFGAIDAANADAAPKSDVPTSGWEPFVDFYGGYATTDGGDVEVEWTDADLFVITRESGTRQVSYDPSFVVGGRVGVFYDFVGLALDASYFRADDENVQNAVFALSGLLMFRMQLLPSDEIPQGRMQPYVGVGPAFLGIFQTVDFRPDISRKLDVTNSGVGLDARAGLRWFFGEKVGFFAEYRILHAKFKDKDRSEKFLFGYTETKVKGDLTTQQILGGLTFRF